MYRYYTKYVNIFTINTIETKKKYILFYRKNNANTPFIA